jgi:hypothetical protein
MQRRPDSWRCCVPAAILAVLGVGGVAFARLAPVADAAEPVAVFSLGGDALASVLAAGGRILSPGGLPGSIIAIGDAPDFSARLYAAGASLVLRADGALGCAETTATPAARTES